MQAILTMIIGVIENGVALKDKEPRTRPFIATEMCGLPSCGRLPAPVYF